MNNRRPEPGQDWNSFASMNASPRHKAKAARLVDEANEFGALDDPQILGLMQALVAAPWDAQLLRFVEDALQPYRLQNVLAPDLFRPYPSSSDSCLDQGDIVLGEIRETGLLWRLAIKDLTHLLATGATGSGKTFFSNGFLRQIVRYLPVIMVTLKESDARLLVDPPVFHQAFKVEELKLSLFTPPPGVSEAGWHRDVAELICKIWGLQLSRSVLHQACDELRHLYAEYSKHKGAPYSFTPKILHKMLKRKRSKYGESICAAIEILCRSTGDIFEHSQGYPVDQLLVRQSTLLIIASLSNDQVGRFFVDWLMLWSAQYLQQHGPNNGSPQLVLVLDDAHSFLSQANEKNSSMPLTTTYLTVRQAGLRICAISQCPSDLAPAVLSQSGVLYQVGALSHSRDCATMGAAFGLPSKDYNRLQTVNKAEFVARENLGRCHRAFAGSVQHFPEPTFTLSDADRQRMMTPILSAFRTAPSVSLEEVECISINMGTNAVSAKVPGQVSPGVQNLAHDILAYPWDFLSERYRRLGIAGRKAQTAKQELVDKGWVKEHKIPRRGGAPILLEPLQALTTALGQPPSSTGKGGFLHAFGQHAVVTRLKSLKHTGIKKEKFYGTKAVDVVATDPNGGVVGFEIAISLSNLVDNIEKDFLCQPAFALITTLCLSSAEVRQAQRMIAAAPAIKPYASRIRVETLARWLP